LLGDEKQLTEMGNKSLKLAKRRFDRDVLAIQLEDIMKKVVFESDFETPS